MQPDTEPAAPVDLGSQPTPTGDTMLLTVMQQRIAPEYMARVFSSQFLASSISQPFSLIAAGFIAASSGPGIVFLIGAAVVMLGISTGFASRELRQV